MVAITRKLRRPSDLKRYFWTAGDYSLLALTGAQQLMLLLLAVCCLQGSSKGKQCVEPYVPVSGGLLEVVPTSGGLLDALNRTREVYEEE